MSVATIQQIHRALEDAGIQADADDDVVTAHFGPYTATVRPSSIILNGEERPAGAIDVPGKFSGAGRAKTALRDALRDAGLGVV